MAIEPIYTKLKEIKNELNNELAFNMAISVLIDNGICNASKWTDEEIEEAETPALLSKPLAQEIYKTARNIANTVKDPMDIILFCMTDSYLDTKYFSNRLCQRDLEKMIKRRLANEDKGFDSIKDIDNLCELYGCDAEDFEKLDYKIPDIYWESEE